MLLSDRISHIKKCAFNSKRIVVFSGGNSKNISDLLNEIKQINKKKKNQAAAIDKLYPKSKDWYDW